VPKAKETIFQMLRSCDLNSTELILQYCNSHFNSIGLIFLNCISPSILQLFVSFLRGITELCNPENVFQLATHIFNLFPNALAIGYRQITPILRLVYHLIKPPLIEKALSNEWPSTIQTYLTMVYDTPRTAMFLQNIDLSSLFLLCCNIIHPSLRNILSYSLKIHQSDYHGESFIYFLARLYRENIIDIDSLLSVFLSGKVDISTASFDSLLTFILELRESHIVDRIFNAFIEKTKPTSKAFVGEFYRIVFDHKKQIGIEVALNYPSQFVFPYLLDIELTPRHWMFLIVRKIFGDSTGEKFSKTLNSAAVPPFSTHLIQYLSDNLNISLSPSPVKKGARLRQFVKVGRWLLAVQQCYELQTFELLWQLFERLIRDSTGIVDYNIVCIIQWLFDFQEFVRPHFRRLVNAILELVGDTTHSWALFRCIRKFLYLASAIDLQEFIGHRVYSELEIFFKPSDRTGIYEKLSAALCAHLDDDFCRREMLRLFERSLNEEISNAAILIINCKSLLQYLPESMIEGLVSRINQTLSWEPASHSRREEYLFALGICEIIGSLTTVNIEISCTTIIKYVGRSRSDGLIEPTLNLLVWYYSKHREDLQSLIQECQDRLVSDHQPGLEKKLLVPAIIRLSLIAETEWTVLWEYFAAWSFHKQIKVIATIMWGELEVKMCETIKQLVLQMCGDDWWKLELVSVRGKSCFQKALEIMTDDDALLAVGTIVGDNEIVDGITDWKLLAHVFRFRITQRNEIREILNEKRPENEKHIQAEVGEIFGTEEADEYEDERSDDDDEQ
jgi:hypothetical protein